MLPGILKRALKAGLLVVGISTLGGSTAHAWPKYAKKEMVACSYCHINIKGGGDRNFRGAFYAGHDHSFSDFDNVYESKAAGVTADSVGDASVAKTEGYPDVKVPPALDFMVKDIDGKPVKLARYAGNVIMIVNVASLCGNTPQYAGLEKVYEKYKAKGFTILAFPANDFLKQEPGTNKDIKQFCTSKYKVAFPMFSKIVVKGDGQAPLYKYLTDKQTDEKFGGDIDWNFAKFLINRDGEIVARFPAKTDPQKPEVIDAIQKALDAPKSAGAL